MPDDTSLSECITHEDETGYRNEIKFVDWCSNNVLFLNSQKSPEIVFDFRRNQKEIEPVVINGVEIEIVTEHKYPGTYIDNQLNWNINTHKHCSQANQRIYFRRKLKLFYIDRGGMASIK